MPGLNCWEYKSCGREPGGSKVETLGVCPASVDAGMHGANGGLNGGRLCWVVAGTFCGGRVQGTFGEKVLDCTRCDFMQKVRAEEGGQFRFLTPGQEFDQVHFILGQLEQYAREREQTIRELSTPVLEIWDDVLVLPVVGRVDTHRSAQMMDALLDRVTQVQSRCVIIDVTGVDVMDSQTADYLLKIARAAKLLGSHCVLTGLSPAVSQTLVQIGADLAEVRTLRNLKAGLRECLQYLKGS